MEERNPEQQASIEVARASIYEAQPEMDVAVSFCVRAWHDLGTCRAIGMTIGPIPFSDCVTWSTLYGLDQEATIILWGVICFLDGERAEKEAASRRLERMRGKK